MRSWYYQNVLEAIALKWYPLELVLNMGLHTCGNSCKYKLILVETVLFQICPEYTLQKRRFLKCQCYNIHNVLELAGVKLEFSCGF
jgi:hypothetical protein